MWRERYRDEGDGGGDRGDEGGREWIGDDGEMREMERRKMVVTETGKVVVTETGKVVGKGGEYVIVEEKAKEHSERGKEESVGRR